MGLCTPCIHLEVVEIGRLYIVFEMGDEISNF